MKSIKSFEALYYSAYGHEWHEDVVIDITIDGRIERINNQLHYELVFNKYYNARFNKITYKQAYKDYMTSKEFKGLDETTIGIRVRVDNTCQWRKNGFEKPENKQEIGNPATCKHKPKYKAYKRSIR